MPARDEEQISSVYKLYDLARLGKEVENQNMYHICVDGLCIRLASGVVFVCNNRGLDPNYLHIDITSKLKFSHRLSFGLNGADIPK